MASGSSFNDVESNAPFRSYVKSKAEKKAEVENFLRSRKEAQNKVCRKALEETNRMMSRNLNGHMKLSLIFQACQMEKEIDDNVRYLTLSALRNGDDEVRVLGEAFWDVHHNQFREGIDMSLMRLIDYEAYQQLSEPTLDLEKMEREMPGQPIEDSILFPWLDPPNSIECHKQEGPADNVEQNN